MKWHPRRYDSGLQHAGCLSGWCSQTCAIKLVKVSSFSVCSNMYGVFSCFVLEVLMSHQRTCLSLGTFNRMAYEDTYYECFYWLNLKSSENSLSMADLVVIPQLSVITTKSAMLKVEVWAQTVTFVCRCQSWYPIHLYISLEVFWPEIIVWWYTAKEDPLL